MRRAHPDLQAARPSTTQGQEERAVLGRSEGGGPAAAGAGEESEVPETGGGRLERLLPRAQATGARGAVAPPHRERTVVAVPHIQRVRPDDMAGVQDSHTVLDGE